MIRSTLRIFLSLLLSALALMFNSAWALTQAELRALGSEDFDQREAAIMQIAQSSPDIAQNLLKALQEESLAIDPKFGVLRKDGEIWRDALSNEVVKPSGTLADISLNNRLRAAIDNAANVLALNASDAEIRLNAVKFLIANGDDVPLVVANRLRQTEIPTELKTQVDEIWAKAVIAQGGEADKKTAQMILDDVAKAKARGVWWGHIFSGLSLGSVLLLAALGLAITYGLIGVINMAHGEFLMIGAYATYAVQQIFRSWMPESQDWYVLAALPASFFAAALVGWILERLVLRHLYGRPLETLLATFGVSLILMQSVRMLFGAQNVEVANPAWMSGGIAWAPGTILPYNRLVIIVFSLSVVVLTWAVLNKTRLGLFVRAVTQNRTMAACVGVATWKIDSYAFAFGAGIAGLGGCALSQIGNVGPDLGQTYIIDSFMAVVLGGVGQLAGTVIGSLGLGMLNKFLEPSIGAVLAKIIVLALIVLFIQKRPSGLFALKGRSAET
jgi:urea transport system permease protein